MTIAEAKAILEALLLASPTPLTPERAAEILEITPAQALELLESLQREYQARGSGIEIQAVAHGFQLVTAPRWAPYVEKLLGPAGTGALSHAALETLAIIAYRGPITRAEIEAIRGVRSDRVLATLLERKLIREAGRRDGPGRPILFATSEEFLRYFGLRSLDDLPPLPEKPPAEESAGT